MATSTAVINRCGTFSSLRLDRRRVLLTGPKRCAGPPALQYPGPSGARRATRSQCLASDSDEANSIGQTVIFVPHPLAID